MHGADCVFKYGSG